MYSLGAVGLEPTSSKGLSARPSVCVAVLALLLTAVSEMQLIYAELSGPFPECQKKGQGGGKGLEQ